MPFIVTSKGRYGQNIDKTEHRRRYDWHIYIRKFGDQLL